MPSHRDMPAIKESPLELKLCPLSGERYSVPERRDEGPETSRETGAELGASSLLKEHARLKGVAVDTGSQHDDPKRSGESDASQLENADLENSSGPLPSAAGSSSGYRPEPKDPVDLGTLETTCSCQTPAKIPRPRNAFILYRQHHHAAVLAKYPGRSNPEISKIIGGMWQASGGDIKKVWQRYADEEKQQHLLRYPNYRYQPRRSGTVNSMPDVTQDSSPAGITICARCGGRTRLDNCLKGPSTRKRKQRSQTRSNEGILGKKKKNDSPLEIDPRCRVFDPSPSPKRRKVSCSPSPSTAPPTFLPLSTQSTWIAQTGRSGPEGTGLADDRAESALSERSQSVLRKIHIIEGCCPKVSPYPAWFNRSPRMPIVAVEGDDVEQVTELYQCLNSELRKTQPVTCVDEGDDLTIHSEAYLGGLLNSSRFYGRDKDADDADACRYLRHVAYWRAKSTMLRKLVTVGEGTNGTPQLVLINRYILSRTETAALRLEPGTSTQLEHWHWCAAIWKGCVGPDLSVVIQKNLSGDKSMAVAVERVDEGKVLLVEGQEYGKQWSDRLVHRICFEIIKLVRTFKNVAP